MRVVIEQYRPVGNLRRFLIAVHSQLLQHDPLTLPCSHNMSIAQQERPPMRPRAFQAPRAFLEPCPWAGGFSGPRTHASSRRTLQQRSSACGACMRSRHACRHWSLLQLLTRMCARQPRPRRVRLHSGLSCVPICPAAIDRVNSPR